MVPLYALLFIFKVYIHLSYCVQFDREEFALGLTSILELPLVCGFLLLELQEQAQFVINPIEEEFPQLLTSLSELATILVFLSNASERTRLSSNWFDRSVPSAAEVSIREAKKFGGYQEPEEKRCQKHQRADFPEEVLDAKGQIQHSATGQGWDLEQLRPLGRAGDRAHHSEREKAGGSSPSQEETSILRSHSGFYQSLRKHGPYLWMVW